MMFPRNSPERPRKAQLLRVLMVNKKHPREKIMTRSKLVLTQWFRTMWREDPALRRFRSLETSRQETARASVPLFFKQKA